MRYEICKEMAHDGLPVWAAIAWSDVRMWAEEIASAMHAIHSGRYAVRDSEAAKRPQAAGTVRGQMQSMNDYTPIISGIEEGCQDVRL